MISFINKYLPWNYIALYLAKREYDRYQRWLQRNYEECPRETRTDHQIVIMGVDFETNQPKLKRMRLPHIGNPMKIKY